MQVCCFFQQVFLLQRPSLYLNGLLPGLFGMFQNQILPEAHCYRPSIIAITAHNWLHRYDLDSGKLLEKVFLSSKYKFKLVL